MTGTKIICWSLNSCSLRIPPLSGCLSGVLIPSYRLQLNKNYFLTSVPQLWRRRRCGTGNAITMRDRGKNRKPIQKGRYLSIEGIQAVQALKRAKANGCGDLVTRVIETKVRRLVKFDLVAVLRELQNQGEGSLAFQVFEELRKEDWYKPQLFMYVNIISVLAKNGLQEKLDQVISYLMMEHLEPDTVGFNRLFETLLAFGFAQTAMDCFHLMKVWESEPNESTFRILVSGLESHGDMVAADAVRDEAEKILGRPLVLLIEDITNPETDTKDL